MRRALLLLALLALAPLPAHADGKRPPAPAKPAPKVKTYNFTSLDVEGKLRTPQLLYFLHRMEAEFDATTPVRRSFLPELKRSTDEM
jgi:hypothetical protein